MYRRGPLLFAVLAFCFLGLARAQDAEDAWKGLVVQALYAAGEHQYPKAEQMFVQAVHEAERFGTLDPRVGTTLNSLGLVYRAEKKNAEAEAAYRRALTILEAAYGPETVDVANIRFNIAAVLRDEGKAAQALPYLETTLTAYQALLGGNSVKVASVYCAMGDVFRVTKDYPKAVTNFKRCADMREADGGIQNPELAETLHMLALTYGAQGNYSLAEANFKLSEKITESTAGISSPVLAGTVDDHVLLLKQIGGREKEVERFTKLSESIRRLQSKKKS